MRCGILDASDDAAPVADAARAGRSLRLGDDLVVWAEDDRWDEVAGAARSRGMPLREHPASIRPEDLRLVVQVGRTYQQDHPDARVILDKGRYLVVEHAHPEDDARPEQAACSYEVRPVPAGGTVFSMAAPSARAEERWIRSLTDRVSTGSYDTFLQRLTALPTRHSLSSHFMTAGDWAGDELRALGYEIGAQDVPVGTGTSRNLIADRRGTGAPPRNVVVVAAHLDSVNLRDGPAAPAPGADDNASGAAGLLEIARVLAAHAALHDLRLILFGGEEQGLLGSLRYVAEVTGPQRSAVSAVVNMDMIASLNSPQATVLLEGAEASRELVDALASAAATYTTLQVQTSFVPFASDHVPFLDAGMPAVLTIEGTDSANANIHTAGDSVEHLDVDLAAEIIRMNVAAVAEALGADVP